MKEKAKPIQISGRNLGEQTLLETCSSEFVIYSCLIVFFFSAEDMDGKTEDEIEMMKMMGFASFDTTKVRAR